MERYAGIPAEVLTKRRDDRLARGRSWKISRRPKPFILDWKRYEQRKRPGVSLVDYLVIQLRGTVTSEWVSFYRRVQELQTRFETWRRQSPQRDDDRAQVDFLLAQIPQVFPSPAAKSRKSRREQVLRAQYDGGQLDAGD